MPGDGQAHARPVLGTGDLPLRLSGGEQGVQAALLQGVAAVAEGEDGPAAPAGQGEDHLAAGGGLGGVGEQGENQLLQQPRVTGDEQGGQGAPEGQGDPRLPQQEGGLLSEAAAQPGQVHGHRAERDPLGGAGGAQEVQVGEQAVDPAEALAEGVHAAPGGAGDRLKFQQDIL